MRIYGFISYSTELQIAQFSSCELMKTKLDTYTFYSI